MPEVINTDDIAKRLKPYKDDSAWEGTALPSWVRQDLFAKSTDGPIFSRVVASTADVTIVTDTRPAGKSDIRAKRFIAAVKGGLPMWEAARQQGTTLNRLFKLNGTRSIVKQLMEEDSLPAAVRKEMVRSGLNKVFADNINGDLKQQKVALAAAKQIAADPEVGLTAPPIAVGVNVDMKGLFQMVKDMKPIEGLEDLISTHQQEILEGDVKENDESKS